MKNNWVRSKSGSSALVKQPKKTRAQAHTIIGAIHSSSVVHVVIRKTSTKKKKKLIMERREP
ncbi:hypothetical protein BCV71DRAFT_226803 [Rhizopus microsporus]|uniref:Uncharacterized protein n=1 Tax=Rhizopus microsporus TaxID=58291 RepID=A0A1X0S2T4_RHIZD|nr:hypothetical protein BCV71DRAFT_226803 [Rhizopus microsporus]